MVRWRAVGLGCLVALGMQAAIGAAAASAGLSEAPASRYAILVLALALAGYVAGHLAGLESRVLHGALAASAYILVAATLLGAQEALLAARAGALRLPPINFIQLAADDVVALLSASVGAWLARGEGDPGAHPPSPSDSGAA